MIRCPLDPSELLFADDRTTVTYSLYGTGSVCVGSLEKAAAALSARYPVLSGQVVPVGDGRYDLVLYPDRPPSVRIGTGPVDALIGGDAALVGPDEVCAIDITQHNNDFRLTLLTHHSIADGKASLRYLDDLCRLYTALATGGSADTVTPLPLPRSVEQILREQGIEKSCSPIEFAVLTDMEPLPPAASDQAEVHQGRLRLSAEQTRAVYARAKEHGVTVHGAVSSAVLLAAQQQEGICGPADFVLISAVDLRTRVEPVVPPEGGTNILGADTAIVTVDPDGDPYDPGRAVLASISDNLANQTIHQGFLHQWELQQLAAKSGTPYAAPGMKSVMLTNWGPVSMPHLPDDLTVNDFRGCINRLPNPERLAAEARASAMGVIVTTFDGRLSLEFQAAVIDGEGFSERQTAALRRAFDRL